MFEKYIKESRALQKQMQEFQEKAQASLNQSIGGQSAEFKSAVIDIIAKAKKRITLPAKVKHQTAVKEGV
jgi:hypothetical protein